MEGNQTERRSPWSGEPHDSKMPVGKPMHSFLSHDRASMSVSGVSDVISFDENEVLLVTTVGKLSLEGTGLHVNVLNTRDGLVEVTGKLYGIYYDDNEDPSRGGSDKHKGKRGFFGRFFA